VQVDALLVRYCHKQFRHSISFGLLRALRGYIDWADVVHLTAVYSFPTLPTLSYCRFFGKPMVWSPRGALQRWEGSTRLIAKSLWELACRNLALKEKLVLHTTSEAEAAQSLKRFPGVRAVIVRNGVELPLDLKKTDPKGILRLAYLGRLDPIKGLEALLEACSLLDRETDPWHLDIAGTGTSAYLNFLKAKVAELRLDPHVQFLGEVSGRAKEDFLANSDVVLAPSYVENFGMAIAEALAHEVPVIASRGTPWEGLQTKGCGLWVDNDPQSLAAAIREIRTMPLGEMGRRGRLWMEREFSWHFVSNQMLAVYRECLARDAI
jgi:glycosyltransferase involved in cell wall biosynthesis